MYKHIEDKKGERGCRSFNKLCYRAGWGGGKHWLPFFKDLFLLYGFLSFPSFSLSLPPPLFLACMCICVLHVFIVLSKASRECWIIWILRLEGLQIIVSRCHMGSGNQTSGKTVCAKTPFQPRDQIILRSVS